MSRTPFLIVAKYATKSTERYVSRKDPLGSVLRVWVKYASYHYLWNDLLSWFQRRNNLSLKHKLCSICLFSKNRQINTLLANINIYGQRPVCDVFNFLLPGKLLDLSHSQLKLAANKLQEVYKSD